MSIIMSLAMSIVLDMDMDMDKGMSPFRVFDWNKSFETGIDKIDQQHFKLVSLINALGAGLIDANNQDSVALQPLIDALYAYAQHHFDTEESLMHQAGVLPKYQKHHHALHQGFLTQLEQFSTALNQNGLEVVSLFDFLCQWLALHVLEEDMAATDQIRSIEKGISPQVAYKCALKTQYNGIDSLLTSVKSLHQFIAGQNSKLTEVNVDLRERIKELNCRNSISMLVAGNELSPYELLSQVVHLIPPGWYYPDMACARIVFNNQTFVSKGFIATSQILSADLEVKNVPKGRIEICYREDMPERDQGPFLNEEVSLLQELATLLSITLQRLTSDSRLARSDMLFRAVTENANDAIIVADQEGNIQHWNARAESLFGYSSQEVVFQPISMIMPQRFREQHNNGLSRFKRHGQTSKIGRTHQLTGLTKAGQEFPVELSLSSFVLEGATSFTCIARDMTEYQRYEEDINTYIEKLNTSLTQTVKVAMAMGEMRDPYTAGHQRRVAEISVGIAAQLDFSEHQLDGMRIAGYLHDIGKIKMPAELLSKPARLSPVEFMLVQEHADAGYDILKDVDFPWPVAEVARQHHERMDGSGYPQGLKGDDILMEARIVAVADVVEAMSSHRPYRAGLGLDAALTEIESGRGTKFDAQVVDACVSLFRDHGFVIPA